MYNFTKVPKEKYIVIELQDRVYEEIIQKTRSENEYCCFNELNNLSYMECVVKECLRLYPGAPFIGRRSGGELKLKDGRILPKYVEIFLHIFYVHRNEKYWPEPEKFNPDRFLPENSVGRHRFAFVPFSAGPRQCPGRYQLISNFQFLFILCEKYVQQECST